MSYVRRCLAAAPLLTPFQNGGLRVARVGPHQAQPSGPAAPRASVAAYAGCGLALNVAGGMAGVAMLPVLGPAALRNLSFAAIAVPALLNGSFAAHTGPLSAAGPAAKTMLGLPRLAAWSSAHFAMGVAVGLWSSTLPFLLPAQLGVGLALGLGIPAATFFGQLARAALSIGPTTTEAGTAANFQAGDAVPTVAIDQRGDYAWLTLLTMQLRYLFRTAASVPAGAIAGIALTSGLSALTFALTLQRARSLANHADQIDPACASLLLSSAVISSTFWGFELAAVRWQSLPAALRLPLFEPLCAGRGLPRFYTPDNLI